MAASEIDMALGLIGELVMQNRFKEILIEELREQIRTLEQRLQDTERGGA